MLRRRPASASSWTTHGPPARHYRQHDRLDNRRDRERDRDHLRAELAEAGLPVLENEMANRVAYPEASLWGATPSLISWKGPAAKEIAAIADELDAVLGIQQAAA